MPDNLSSLLGGQAVPLTIELDGLVYEARPVSQTLKGSIELEYQQRVIRPFLSLQESAGGDRYDRAVILVADRIAEGRWSFYTEGCARWLGTPEAVLLLVKTVFALRVSSGGHRPVTEQEATALLTRKRAETTATVNRVLRDSFPGLLKDDDQGNGPAPEPSPPPGPSAS